MKIGVFDSGIGGLSVVNAINKELPDLEVVYINDPDNLPYGTKTKQQLLDLVIPRIADLIDQGCWAVVIACNTVTTTIIADLRRRFDVPLIGLEPMIKPAVKLTKTKTIAVCATRATLNSQRYRDLKKEFAVGVTVLEPDCSDWAILIEDNALNQMKIESTISPLLDQGADVIVLGCTHYHWIEEDIVAIANKHRVQVMQPEKAVVEHLKRVLEQLS